MAGDLQDRLQAAEAGSDGTCRTCRFYGEGKTATGHLIGQCRRRAPQQFYGEGWCHNGWPSVEDGDWCGEYIALLATDTGGGGDA